MSVADSIVDLNIVFIILLQLSIPVALRVVVLGIVRLTPVVVSDDAILRLQPQPAATGVVYYLHWKGW